MTEVHSAIAAYVDEVVARLHVGRGEADRIGEEITDHLYDAAADRGAGGASEVEAVSSAIAAIGTAGDVAAGFNAAAGTRAMRRAPVVAFASGVVVVAGFLFAAVTQPAAPGRQSASALTQVTFFAAVIALEIAVVAGARAASRAVSWRHTTAASSADRVLVWRCAAVSLASLGVAVAGWSVTFWSVAANTGRGSSTLLAGALVMAAGVLAGALALTRLPSNADDDLPSSAPPQAADRSPWTAGERAIRFVADHSVPACAAAAFGAAALAMSHAETSAVAALPWGIAQAAAVVVGFVLFRPLLRASSEVVT